MTFNLEYSRPEATQPEECQKVDQNIKTSHPSAYCWNSALATLRRGQGARKPVDAVHTVSLPERGGEGTEQQRGPLEREAEDSQLKV